MEAQGETRVLARLRRGDVAALGALMDRWAPRLYRVACGITRSDADAEEVVQDVFLALARKGDTFEGRAALGTWLYRVVTNAAVNKRRGRRAEGEVSVDELLPRFQPDGHRDGASAWLTADWSRTPDAALAVRETRAALTRALEALPPPSRAVVGLRDGEG